MEKSKSEENTQKRIAKETEDFLSSRAHFLTCWLAYLTRSRFRTDTTRILIRPGVMAMPRRFCVCGFISASSLEEINIFHVYVARKKKDLFVYIVTRSSVAPFRASFFFITAFTAHIHDFVFDALFFPSRRLPFIRPHANTSLMASNWICIRSQIISFSALTTRNLSSTRDALI